MSKSRVFPKKSRGVKVARHRTFSSGNAQASLSKRRFNAYLPALLLDTATAYADRTGNTLTQVIRTALEEFFRKERKVSMLTSPWIARRPHEAAEKP